MFESWSIFFECLFLLYTVFLVKRLQKLLLGQEIIFFMHSALIFDAYLSVHYIYENVYWCLPQNLLVYWYGIFFPYVWTLLAEDGS